MLFIFLFTYAILKMQVKPLDFLEKRGIIMARSIIDKLIYSVTQKPKHYKEVRNPPKTDLEKLFRPQDARQMQYNRWSKRHKVYSGSYLPRNHRDLLKKGWKKKRVSDQHHHFYQRKSTNQTIRYDDSYTKPDGTFVRGDHYHWYMWWKKYFGSRKEAYFRHKQYQNNKTEKVYYNEYEEKTSLSNPDHHIYPQN